MHRPLHLSTVIILFFYIKRRCFAFEQTDRARLSYLSNDLNRPNNTPIDPGARGSSSDGHVNRTKSRVGNEINDEYDFKRFTLHVHVEAPNRVSAEISHSVVSWTIIFIMPCELTYAGGENSGCLPTKNSIKSTIRIRKRPLLSIINNCRCKAIFDWPPLNVVNKKIT